MQIVLVDSQIYDSFNSSGETIPQHIMKNKYYEIRYINMNGKDKTANISAKSESDAIKKFKAEPLFWDMDKIIYPISAY